MRHAVFFTALAAGLLGAPRPGSAAVFSASDSAFVVKIEMTIRAEPTEVYARFLEFGRWWSAEHSFSGSAARFSLQAEPGGCLCESLPGGGFVRHSVVVLADPGKMIRLDGSLGPLMMSGGSTSLTVALKPGGAGTQLALSFVGRGEDVKPLAAAYDEVLGLQFARLKRYVETGKAGDS